MINDNIMIPGSPPESPRTTFRVFDYINDHENENIPNTPNAPFTRSRHLFRNTNNDNNLLSNIVQRFNQSINDRTCSCNNKCLDINDVIHLPFSPIDDKKIVTSDDLECSICFETICRKTGGHLMCGHYFHNRCISKWFMDTTTCPMCRKEDNPKEYL